jgi:hypothetical protein
VPMSDDSELTLSDVSSGEIEVGRGNTPPSKPKPVAPNKVSAKAQSKPGVKGGREDGKHQKEAKKMKSKERKKSHGEDEAEKNKSTKKSRSRSSSRSRSCAGRVDVACVLRYHSCC